MDGSVVVHKKTFRALIKLIALGIARIYLPSWQFGGGQIRVCNVARVERVLGERWMSIGGLRNWVRSEKVTALLATPTMVWLCLRAVTLNRRRRCFLLTPLLSTKRGCFYWFQGTRTKFSFIIYFFHQDWLKIYNQVWYWFRKIRFLDCHVAINVSTEYNYRSHPVELVCKTGCNLSVNRVLFRKRLGAAVPQLSA